MNKITGKKGQAALEFLTTYGWAFMVILVMIGALAYFGILNPQNLVRDQCMATAGFDCVAASIASPTGTTGVVNITFTNNIGKSLDIVRNINFTLGSGTQDITESGCTFRRASDGQAISATYTLNEEDVALVYCDLSNLNGKSTGDKIKVQYTLEYKATGTGELPHLVSGSATTTVR